MKQILNCRLALVLAEKAQNSEKKTNKSYFMKYQISVCNSFVYCVVGQVAIS